MASHRAPYDQSADVYYTAVPSNELVLYAEDVPCRLVRSEQLTQIALITNTQSLVYITMDLDLPLFRCAFAAGLVTTYTVTPLWFVLYLSGAPLTQRVIVGKDHFATNPDNLYYRYWVAS